MQATWSCRPSRALHRAVSASEAAVTEAGSVAVLSHGTLTIPGADVVRISWTEQIAIRTVGAKDRTALTLEVAALAGVAAVP